MCIGIAALAACSGRLASPAAMNASLGPGDCDGSPPASAVRQVSLAMIQVNFGDDPDASAWQAIAQERVQRHLDRHAVLGGDGVRGIPRAGRLRAVIAAVPRRAGDLIRPVREVVCAAETLCGATG
jgi:hypothetical protein